MHNRSKRLALIGILTVLGAALGVAAPALAAYGRYAYHYCYANEGDIYYFSDVFTLETGAWAKGAENSFHSFVTGRLSDGSLDYWQCMGPYETATEAEDKLNDHIGERRYEGDEVVVTHWRYHGD
jgi:hypothetical protein